MKLFSIITVCKNDLDDLKKTVKSVRMQNFKNYEYIIVDGGSNDGSLDYIKSIRNIKYISEPDDGIYDAMNKALKHCSGNYVCFMNSGDIFYDKYVLNNIAKEIRKNSNIDFFYGDYIYPSICQNIIKNPTKISKFFLFRTGICHQAWFLKREIYHEVNGFDLSFKFLSDYDLLLKVIIEKNISYKHIPIHVVKYKGGGFSLSNLNTREKEKRIIQQKYFTKLQIYFFSFILIFFNKMKPIYKNIISFFN